MKRRILALCMAMCMTATTVFAGTASLGGLTTAYAADEDTGQMTITVSAYDYTAVAAGLADASDTGVIMEQEVTVPVASATDAASVIQEAFDTAGVSVAMGKSYYGTTYVSSINDLGEGTGGAGWCLAYRDGAQWDDYSNWGIDSLTLKDGDAIRLDYSNNTDYATDDIGNGWYGNPIVKSMTIAGQSFTMASTTTYDANYNATYTYSIDGETTTATGTEDDPFVFEVTLPANEAEEAVITAESNLNSHYAVTDGITLTDEGATYDIIDGLDFSISSLGGKYKSYFTIKTTTTENKRSDSYETKLENAINYISSTVTDPVVGSIGGEWAVIALARYGYENPEWYTKYYNAVVSYVEANGSSKLHARKGTDNSRVIMGLTAIGADPTNVHGYNLLTPLADYDYVIYQGINGPIYALIALDTGDYEIPSLPEGSTATQTTRENLIEYILSCEIDGGGWALGSATTPDPDITTMAVQALAPYCDTNSAVKAAVDRGMKAISAQQKNNGGLASWGTVNSESCAQTICALSDLSRDADTDSEFVKKGSSVLDAILKFYIEDCGGFAHAAINGKYSVNQMGTEQATYALVSYYRYKNGMKTLYDMSDRKVLYNVDTSKPNLSTARVVIDDSGLVADGTAKEPEVTVYYGDIKLTEGTDYTKEFSDNIEVGTDTAKVTITAIGDTYEGSTESTFSIHSAAITADDVQFDIQEPYYANRTAKKPGVTVTYDGNTLTSGTDYTVECTNNFYPGTATITVKGEGLYTGTVEKTFEILATDLTAEEFATTVSDISSVSFTGKENKPTVTVKCNGSTLRNNTDYTLSYKNNINAGTATVEIVGKSCYTGTVTKTFKIVPLDIYDTSVTLETEETVYSGVAQTPKVIAKNGETELVEGTDYTVAYANNTTAGTAAVTVSGCGNYYGKTEKTFAIKTLDITGAKVTLSEDVMVADGTEKKPEVTVTVGDVKLTEGTDYTVTYSDNVNVGKAAVKVEGIGSCTGSAETTFDITKPDISKAKVTVANNIIIADGTEKKPEVTVTLGDEKLKSGTDYTVIYLNNVNAGKATVKVEGTGKYTGSAETTFDIQKAANVKVTLSSANGSSNKYVKVKWNSDNRATSYYVYRKSSSDKSYKKIAETKTASYTDKSVSGGTVYSYVVKPISGKVVLGSSADSSIRVMAKTTASAKNQSKGVVISWKKVTGASKYVVIRRLSGSNKWTTVGTVTSTSITDKKAVKGKTYWYIVKAVGTNTYSKSKAVSMYRLSAPAVKKLTTTKKAVFKISYGKDKTASGYQIQYSKSKKFTGSKIYTVKKNSTVSASIRTAKAGTKYYVRIRTYKKDGSKTYYSAWGSTKSVTVKK